MKILKKSAALITAFIMLFSVSAFADEISTDISIVIDSENLIPTDVNGTFVPPFVQDGTTYVPVRAISQAFGLPVAWDQDTMTVFIGQQSGSATLNDYINIYIDGEELAAKNANGTRVYPILLDGTTYMPLRAIGEALGKTVLWDNVTRTAYIITPLTDEDKANLKKALSDTVALEGYTAQTQFLQNLPVEPITTELTSDSLAFSLLSDGMLSTCAGASDNCYYAVVDASFFLGFTDIPSESFNNIEFGKFIISIQLDNGLISSETGVVSARILSNEQIIRADYTTYISQ